MLGAAAKGEESPIILHPTDDTWIARAHPTGIFGYIDSMRVTNAGLGPNPSSACNSLVKIDLSSIPPGALIASAKLFLCYHFCSQSDPSYHCRFRYLASHRMTIDWDEDTVSWDDISFDYDLDATDVSQIQICFGWIDWDVTSDVQSMVSGEENNYGWIIMDNVTYTFYLSATWFRTKESGDHIPFLEITLESEEWPMFHHDASNKGYNNSKTPETNEKLWDVSPETSIWCSPAVVDGKLYFGSEDMYCYDANDLQCIWILLFGI